MSGRLPHSIQTSVAPAKTARKWRLRRRRLVLHESRDRLLQDLIQIWIEKTHRFDN